MMPIGGIPSLVMTHLSQAYDEQMGQLLQSNQLAGMGARGAQSETAQSASALGFTSMHAAQLAGSSGTTGVPGLHSMAMEKGNLHTASAHSGTGLFDDTARRLSESRRQRNANSGGESKQEQEVDQRLELEACRVVVQVAFMIEQQGMFSNYLVATLYQEAWLSGTSSSSPRQMVLVAVMDESNQRVPVHATLLSMAGSGKAVTRRLPGQLVWGRCRFTPDWVAVHLEQEQQTGIWRLQAEGFQDQLAGVAVARGDIPAFAGSGTDISLHMPGAARYWVKL